MKKMMAYCRDKGYGVEGKIIDVEKLVFEERVKMNCFYCGKYNSNWKCPPKIPAIDYQKMLWEFENAAFIYLKMPFDKKNFSDVRNDSSLQLHRAMLECEKYLWENDNVTALSFIGGSCKLCRNGCALDRCANPYMSRSPVEALGINVIESAKKFGIDIDFPPVEHMIRIGLLLW